MMFCSDLLLGLQGVILTLIISINQSRLISKDCCTINTLKIKEMEQFENYQEK